jgi:hypothetical protein
MLGEEISEKPQIALARLRPGAVKQDDRRMRPFLDRREKRTGKLDLAIVKNDFFLFVRCWFSHFSPQRKFIPWTTSSPA